MMALSAIPQQEDFPVAGPYDPAAPGVPLTEKAWRIQRQALIRKRAIRRLIRTAKTWLQSLARRSKLPTRRGYGIEPYRGLR